MFFDATEMRNLPLLICTILFAFNYFSTTISVGAEQRMTKMRNYNLDVVFMFDQTQWLIETNYKEVHQGLIEWIESYFDIEGGEKTRFAVILCNRPTVSWYFSNGSIKDHVRELMGNISYAEQEKPKLAQCLNAVANDVFNDAAGDRKNAKNLAFYINSNCILDDCHSDIGSKANCTRAANFAGQKNISLIFLCCIDSGGGSATYYWDVMKKFLEDLNQHQSPNDSIIVYANKSQLFDSVDKVIPWIDTELIDCSYTNLTTSCEPVVGLPECRQKWLFEIDQYPKPTKKDKVQALEYGKECLPNGTSEACECPNNNGTTAFVPLLTAEPKSIALLVGVIIGGLVLLIVVLIIVVLVTLHGRKRRLAAINRSQRMSASEHEKGIAADLTPQQAGVGKKIDDSPEGSRKSIVAKNGGKSSTVVKGSMKNRPNSQMSSLQAAPTGKIASKSSFNGRSSKQEK